MSTPDAIESAHLAGAAEMLRMVQYDLTHWAHSVRSDDGQQRPLAAQAVLDMLILHVRTFPSAWPWKAAAGCVEHGAAKDLGRGI